jgi:hypothetical protein
MLNERLSSIAGKLAAMHSEISDLQAELKAASGEWPDFQVVKGAKWKARDQKPPNAWVWMSDGSSVWLVHGRGENIPASATSCKFWTEAFIPAPPIEDAEVVYEDASA